MKTALQNISVAALGFAALAALFSSPAVHAQSANAFGIPSSTVPNH
jgi:hypothetical protein